MPNRTHKSTVSDAIGEHGKKWCKGEKNAKQNL